MKRTPVQLNFHDYPEELSCFLRDFAVYDSSCSADAEVRFIDREEGFFLKTAAEGSLRTESLMTAYMHTLSLSAEVLYYGTSNGKDYLLTRRIPGEDGTDLRYLSDPERLCDTTASFLRRLHERDGRNCPVQDRIRTYTEAVMHGMERHHYEPDLFRDLWEFDSYEEAKSAAEEGLSLLKREVILHGDYCLPNILLKDWEFSGFIDVGNGGIGDRHIDLLWGIWTLSYNLKTTAYTDRFMDAYGRDKIEPEILRMVAAMEMIGG